MIADWRSFAAGLAASVLACSCAAQAQTRVALVIGNSAYQNAARLSNPVRDAQAIAELFRNASFDVVQARNDLGNLEFRRAVREFAEAAQRSDIAVMFFAGHGLEYRGTNYMLPVDAKLATDHDVEDEAVPLDRLIRAIEPARRLRLIILDACRDNPLLRTMQRTVAVRAVMRGLAKVEPDASNTLIAYAARDGSVAEDGDGRHSPFTAALLKHIAQPGLDIQMALRRVRDDVLKSTANRQEPFVYGSLGGEEIPLVPVVHKNVPISIDQNAARRNYEIAERIGGKEAWQSFLAAHATGFYAELARAHLDKLLQDERLAALAREKQARIEPAETARVRQEPPAREEAPAGAAATRQLGREEIAILVKRGKEFIANGDLIAARLVLQRAAERKDAEAALSLATTYDPLVLRQLKVYGYAGDVTTARSWYEKAKEFGSVEAVRRLEMLARGAR
jgi:TPR repeat protein